MQDTELIQTPPYSNPMSFSPAHVEHGASGVSWAAIIAGAVASAALSMILVILGVGLGFSAISPWAFTRGKRHGHHHFNRDMAGLDADSGVRDRRIRGGKVADQVDRYPYG